MPAFPMDVPDAVYEAVANASTPEFADSYLYGATVQPGGKLTMRTLTGYNAMRDKGSVMAALSRLGLTMEKPTPYPGDGTRRSAAEVGGFAPQPKKRGRGDY